MPALPHSGLVSTKEMYAVECPASGTRKAQPTTRRPYVTTQLNSGYCRASVKSIPGQKNWAHKLLTAAMCWRTDVGVVNGHACGWLVVFYVPVSFPQQLVH